MPKIDPAKFKKVSVSLPFGIGSAEWEADPTERRAAWSLYVELVTRIAVQPLEIDEGLLREALTSLYSLFGYNTGSPQTSWTRCWCIPRVSRRYCYSGAE
jgi:hypothetical protein